MYPKYLLFHIYILIRFMECPHHHRPILFYQWSNLTMESLILLVLSERSQLRKSFLQDDILNSMVGVIKGLDSKIFLSHTETYTMAHRLWVIYFGPNSTDFIRSRQIYTRNIFDFQTHFSHFITYFWIKLELKLS